MDSPIGHDPNSRFEKIDKVVLLAQCPLFSGLSPWELRSISQLMRLVEYRKGEIVYHEGGEPESFYVIVSGRFEASVHAAEKRKVLAYLRRGDHFGEMSLLTGQPHSATVHALSDALVLEIKKDDFKKTIEHNATISLELSRRLSSRLKIAESRSHALFRSDVVAIYGNQPKPKQSLFCSGLASALFDETHQKTVLLDLSLDASDQTLVGTRSERTALSRLRDLDGRSPDAVRPYLDKHHAGFDVLNLVCENCGTEPESALIPLLNLLSIDYRFILMDLPGELEDVVLKAVSQSDHIFFITDSHLNSLTEARDMLADLQKSLSCQDEKVSLLIHEAAFGARTTGALRAEMFGKKRCFSITGVATESDPEYSRMTRHIARFLSGNLVGLALGSGAAFGLAHVGILKVLEREKIPVDIIAGSSIGALIGSLYAVGLSAAEVEKVAMEINLRLLATRLIDINIFPVRGLVHGREVQKHFKRHLGNKTFENCRIPLRVTGANLTTRQAVVFDSGSISDAVRTSIAIPAILKPSFLRGDMLVDGGILNPLPIRALHQAGANKVIAVNVFPSSKDLMEKRLMRQEIEDKKKQAAFDRGILHRAAWAAKRWSSRLFFPNIFDILMNTIQAMEAEIAEIEGESADVVLRPVLPNTSWVDFYKPAPFIRRGEEEAVKLLPKIKALVLQQNV